MSAISVTRRVEKFGELIRNVGAGLEAAGKYLVEMLEDIPDAKRQILARFPEFSISLLNQLEAVGRGQLHPRLTMTANPGFVRLRGLPMSDQVRYMEEPVELLVEKDGVYDTLLVLVKDLTAEQAKQVFSADHIRTSGAQRAWMEDAKAHAAMLKHSDEFTEPYKIQKDNTVIFTGNVRMSAAQLTEILSKLLKR